MLGATVIAVLTFYPTFISKSTAGEYCRDLFLVLCISLLASWVMAMVQVPSCVVAWMPLRPKEKGGNGEVKESKLQTMIRKLIGTLIGFRYTTIGVMAALLVLCTFGYTKVKQVFFPDFDYGQFVMEYHLPDQVPIA